MDSTHTVKVSSSSLGMRAARAVSALLALFHRRASGMRHRGWPDTARERFLRESRDVYEVERRERLWERDGWIAGRS